jgi:hypothetical protein
MHIADMLINNASGHRGISFLVCNAGYNEITMVEEDMSKTAFRCPGFIDLFEWVVDVIVKSDSVDNHLSDLCLVLERMHRYGLKMNQLKCVFDVSAGKFLEFIIHEYGIEIDPKKIESVNKV